MGCSIMGVNGVLLPILESSGISHSPSLGNSTVVITQLQGGTPPVMFLGL